MILEGAFLDSKTREWNFDTNRTNNRGTLTNLAKPLEKRIKSLLYLNWMRIDYFTVLCVNIKRSAGRTQDWCLTCTYAHENFPEGYTVG